MELEKAIDGMLKTRQALQSQRGVSDPNFISENMQRLTQYAGAVEEHLANYEEQFEEQMMSRFVHYTKTEGKSVSQAETLTRFELGDLKGEIAKLKRLVNSSWSIIGVAQSRFNHINKGIAGQI